MRAPKFWYSHNNSFLSNMLSFGLIMLSWLYWMGFCLRDCFARPYKTSNAKVVCIGNLVVGGAGKTPTAIAIMQLVKDHKLAKNPAFLSKGYGGRRSGPLCVDLAQHNAKKVGDEPLLLAQYAPTIVSKNRKRGLIFAEREGFDLIIMDDGYQNPTIAKDIYILVVDGRQKFGNQRLLPAGPLRERIESGLNKADIVIALQGGEDCVSHNTIVTATIQPEHHDFSNKDCVAFTGIAHPEKFFQTLENMGLNIVSRYRYPDHYLFQESDLETCAQDAKEKNAQLVTTEKDYVRLSPAWKKRVTPVKIKLECDRQRLLTLLQGHLS